MTGTLFLRIWTPSRNPLTRIRILVSDDYSEVASYVSLARHRRSHHTVASAQTPSNKKEQLPTAILLNCRYVYVEAWDGDFFNPHLLPEDRNAILNVQNAFHDWNRYLITVKRRGAEILVVVRKGRIVSVNGGVAGNVGSGPVESGAHDELGSNQPKAKEGDKVGCWS